MNEAQSERRQSAVRSRKLRAFLFDGTLPEIYGLAFAGVLVLTIVGVALLANFELKAQARESREARAASLAAALAAALADEAVAPDRFQRICNIESLVAAAHFGADGKLLHRWPESPLAPTTVDSTPAAPPVGSAPVTAAPPPDATALTRAVAAIPGAKGRIEAAFRFPPSGLRTTLLLGSALTAVLSIAIFTIIYRRIHRHLRPVAALQSNLSAYASGLESDLAALTVSDALGTVGQSWNQLIAQVTDLNEQVRRAQKAEAAGSPLQRFETRALKQVLDRLPIGVIRFAPSEQIGYANAAAARLLGDGKRDVTGEALSEVLRDPATLRAVRSAVETRSSTPLDRKTGERETDLTLRYVVAPAGDGRTSEIVLTIEDVSHLHEAERARDNFLYHVTHELRTPLTNIQAYAETLTKAEFDDEQTRRECYNVIISETRRLSRLIEDILSISQLEVGTARIDVGEVDLVRLLRQMVQDNLGHADEKGVELSLRLPPKAPKVKGDKQRLSVLLNNLIGNALKYTRSGGQATVTLEVHDDRVEIEVADTGIGIAPEDQPRVFEKFYRAASEDVQEIKGTGLGLAIAREVARMHGGDIRLKSEKGKGSTFTIELPRGATEPQGVAT